MDSETSEIDQNITDEDDSDDEMTNSGKYLDFKRRKINGTLYKIDSIDSEAHRRVSVYVNNGTMQKDLRYAREIFGLINTSGKKDFSYVWESPWIEEHVRDTTKRKKQEAYQRSLAVKNFLKASSNHDSDNVDRFITNVDRLTQWEDKYNNKENVKTISRVVQSFERVAVRQLLNFSTSLAGKHYLRVAFILDRLRQNNATLNSPKSMIHDDISYVANALRRSDAVYDVFANIVASEINWADSTNGTKNLSIYANRLLESKKEGALTKLVHAMDALQDDSQSIPCDTIGLPLMEIDSNICVSHGIIVVGSNSNTATYILDISMKNEGELNLDGIKNIIINKTVDEKKQNPELLERVSKKSKRNVAESKKSLIDL